VAALIFSLEEARASDLALSRVCEKKEKKKAYIEDNVSLICSLEEARASDLALSRVCEKKKK